MIMIWKNSSLTFNIRKKLTLNLKFHVLLLFKLLLDAEQNEIFIYRMKS